MTNIKRGLAVGAASAALALIPVAPAVAQPVITGGLVNVTVTNLLNNNTVQVAIPVTAAANICNVSVSVITDLVNNGGTCTARSGNQTLTF
jgi:mannose/fructose/N-acetylgalactosamine-specific phosphotransferase system component IIC